MPFLWLNENEPKLVNVAWTRREYRMFNILNGYT